MPLQKILSKEEAALANIGKSVNQSFDFTTIDALMISDHYANPRKPSPLSKEFVLCTSKDYGAKSYSKDFMKKRNGRNVRVS